jgi:hypothetical protein
LNGSQSRLSFSSVIPGGCWNPGDPVELHRSESGCRRAFILSKIEGPA